jgi:cellulose synthase/poly-beta-1,6-N-acetylglucosamine synthase-like glycosyltransferase
MAKDRAERIEMVGRFKPVLGLSETPGEPAALGVSWGTVFDQPEPEELLELTVIIPARNEEDCLAACLESLVSQSEKVFELGRDWELIVVDDHSTDRTAQIANQFARGFAGVTVIGAGPKTSLDRQEQRPLDGGSPGARPLAALHRRRYDSRAGKSASRPA